MKKLTFSVLFCLLATALRAGSVAEMWTNMPDSILPILDRNMRTELVDNMKLLRRAEVVNLLGDTCAIDTLADNYARLTLSRCSSMQLMLLPRVEGDTILCMVKTLAAPERESEVRFFDSQWHPLSTETFLADIHSSAFASTLIARPDSMTEDRFSELSRMIEPQMVFASLNPEDISLTFSLALPLAYSEDKKGLKAILVQRKVKLEGKMFK